MVHRLLLMVLAELSGTTSYAQERTQPWRPPVEIGVGLDKVVPFSLSVGEAGLEGFDAFSVSVRGTVPFTARYAIEGIVSFQRRDEQYARFVDDVTEVMYAVQIKRGRRRNYQPIHTFATFGAAGVMHRRIRPERVIGPPGGEQVIPRSVDQTVIPPVAALLGGGIQYDFPHTRMAFRADAQVAMLLYLPVGVRASASLTIPFGRTISP
jgi:hypothetical protein